MAKPRQPKPGVDRIDDDVPQVPPEGIQQAGPDRTDANQIFQEAAASAVVGDWKERGDQWDHRTYNPEFHLGEDRQNADGTYRRRRAAPDAQTRAQGARVTSTKARPLPISTVEIFLVSTHAMLAGVLEVPELKLTTDDANNLAVPITKVAALYDVKVDPRLEAYGMLIIACIGVYGPKIGQFMERMKAEQARNVTPRPQGPGNVQVLHPVPVPPKPAEAVQEGKGPPAASEGDVMKIFGDLPPGMA